MQKFCAIHPRLSFYIALIPGLFLIVAGMTWLGEGYQLLVFAVFLLWTLGAFSFINRQSYALCQQGMDILNRACDPEPLLAICQEILAKNKRSLLFRVHEGYALALLGRQEEAMESARLAGDDPKLSKNVWLLMVWSATIPPDDPRQVRAIQCMKRLSGTLNQSARGLLDWALVQRSALALPKEPSEQIEEKLKFYLAQAPTPREAVGGHLALGAYYASQGDKAAKTHLHYVLNHANKLHGAKEQAQKLLELLK